MIAKIIIGIGNTPPTIPPPMNLKASLSLGIGLASVKRNVNDFAMLIEPKVPTKAGTFR